ncbi:replication endonuclease [Methylotenera sp.]|uniref:replication endonuclease n=1 Tax=Methylotenera sp. TaxID=2051956 RepID=UPI00272FEB0B|nr:replication endonuclease [Methylotenera sp.]MDP2071569.1 replication endonuclease [Methylotenera sp.]MDP3006660.1 replication endonuclease [Methylotenera sp.]
MKYNREREQVQFVDNIILKLPRKWGNTARKQHAIKAEKSLKEANLWLLDLSDATKGSIDIGASDDDLILLSVDMVARVRVLMSEQTTRGGVSKAFNLYETLEALCFELNVRYPIEHDRKQILARLSDASWWLRGLRVAHNKRAEGAALNAGLVSKRAEVYCSDDALERRKAQRRRNIETLENINMVNTANGEVMSLGAIAATGTSNHENRRAELVTRMRGFEELATKYGHSSEFVTVTTPSRMHAVLANGKANQKYDGTKPDDAQKYLVECWARVRALLAKNGVRFYGLRIAEPHHDGTPHWHLILFYRKCDKLKEKIRGAFRLHFLADSGDEAGAKQNRVKFVSINPLKGSAAGYVLKYVLKNIGGLGDGEKSDESEMHSSETLYERVEAWAACWRIRQFQQIGGHYVSVWRELRRVDEGKLEGKRPEFVKAWQACQKNGDIKANFAQFIESMGGLETPPRKSLFMVDYDVLNVHGRYGDTLSFKVLGVGERFGFEVVATNRAEWVQA